MSKSYTRSLTTNDHPGRRRHCTAPAPGSPAVTRLAMPKLDDSLEVHNTAAVQSITAPQITSRLASEIATSTDAAKKARAAEIARAIAQSEVGGNWMLDWVMGAVPGVCFVPVGQGVCQASERHQECRAIPGSESTKT